jgi:hypothetical protein
MKEYFILRSYACFFCKETLVPLRFSTQTKKGVRDQYNLRFIGC